MNPRSYRSMINITGVGAMGFEVDLPPEIMQLILQRFSKEPPYLGIEKELRPLPGFVNELFAFIPLALSGLLPIPHASEKVWSKELPTEPGYYWFDGCCKDSDGEWRPDPLIIKLNGGGAVEFHGGEYFYEVEQCEGRWCGPLQQPEARM